MKKTLTAVTVILLTLLFSLSVSANDNSVCTARCDTDNDKKVSAADARYILRASVGLEKTTEELIKKCDTDSDGRLTSADARFILRLSVGLENGLEHITEILPAKTATCTENGLTQGEKCSLCNTVIKKQEVTAKAAHTLVTDKAVEATCTTTGLTEGAHCSVCNAVITKQEEIKATGHSEEKYISEQPTMTEKGTYTVRCTKCGEKLSESDIPSLGSLVNEGSAPIDINIAVNEEYKWMYSEELSEEGKTAFCSSNKGVGSSASNIALTVKGSGYLTFEYYVSSEVKFDGLNIGNGRDTGTAPFTSRLKNTSPNFKSGETGWQTFELEIDGETESETVIYIGYTKDKSSDGGKDLGAIRNINYLSGEQTVNISSEPAEGGKLTLTANGNEYNGSEVKLNVKQSFSLKAEAYEGYSFLCIKDGNGSIVSGVPEVGLTLKTSQSYTAVFYETEKYEASINSVLYESIDDALKAAVSGDTVKILRDCTLKESAEVKQGVTLLVPCLDNDTGYTSDGFNPDNPRNDISTLYTDGTLYITLTVPENAELKVSGLLLVNAVTGKAVAGSPSGYGITGNYGKIQLNGKITVLSGGTLDASGRIEGKGRVTLEKGAKMYETYSIERWRGGTFSVYTQAEKLGNYPIYESSMNTVKSELYINSGATLAGTVKLYASDNYFRCRFMFIDNSSGLIRLSENAYCVRQCVYDSELTAISSSGTVKGAYRDIYKFYGGADFTSSSMKLAGMNLTTDRYGYYNFDGDLSFELNGGTYNFSNKFRFLTGFYMKVNSDAVLNVSSTGGIMLVDSTFPELDGKFWRGYTYPTGRSDSQLYVCEGGKLNVAGSGEIAGKVIYENEADISISETAVKTLSFKVTEAPGGTNVSSEYKFNPCTVELKLIKATD